jgi:hypothetical protein
MNIPYRHDVYPYDPYVFYDLLLQIQKFMQHIQSYAYHHDGVYAYHHDGVYAYTIIWSLNRYLQWCAQFQLTPQLIFVWINFNWNQIYSYPLIVIYSFTFLINYINNTLNLWISDFKLVTYYSSPSTLRDLCFNSEFSFPCSPN